MTLTMTVTLGLAAAALGIGGTPPGEVERRLEAAGSRPWVELETIGRSVGGRPLHAVRLHRPDEAVEWRVLLVGQQHGDEPAGKEAMLELVERVAADPDTLPVGVDVWVVPLANPDGAAEGRRRNGAGADLNRDHLLLDQPETRALHALARRIRPHLVVDGHEFTRDSSDYRDRGWGEWPVVTMDTANSLLLPDAVYEVGLRWVRDARAAMAAAGIPYRRYLVGGLPPDEEMRPSTLEADDARNGLALAAGGLGVIIESGVRRAAPDPMADLAQRVAGYRVLLERFLHDRELRRASLDAVAEARRAAPPAFLPVNVLWGNVGMRLDEVPVVDLGTGATVLVPTARRMHDRVVKGVVAAPAGYAVEAASAAPYRELLDRHGIPYRVLDGEETMPAERCVLEGVQAERDAVHERYGGRQLVRCEPASTATLGPGSLVVPLGGDRWRTLAALLEPRQLYGLYQYERFRGTVAEDGGLPVWRLPSAGGLSVPAARPR